MLDLKKATYPEHIDLLNVHTSSYIDMLRTRAPEEQFMRCKLNLKKVQQEIELRVSRNSKVDNSTTSSSSQQGSSVAINK